MEVNEKDVEEGGVGAMSKTDLVGLLKLRLLHLRLMSA